MNTGQRTYISQYQQNKANLRREKDVHKLMVSEFEVTMPNQNETNELKISFGGPKGSPYEGVRHIRFLISLIIWSFLSI